MWNLAYAFKLVIKSRRRKFFVK